MLVDSVARISKVRLTLFAHQVFTLISLPVIAGRYAGESSAR
jgi:hypothetical protein